MLKESLAHDAAGSGVAEDCEAGSGAALMRATPGRARGTVAAVAGTSAAPAVAPATVHCGESRCWLIVANGTFLPQTGQAQKREPEPPLASMDAPLAGAADLGRFKKRSIGDFSRQMIFNIWDFTLLILLGMRWLMSGDMTPCVF